MMIFKGMAEKVIMVLERLSKQFLSIYDPVLDSKIESRDCSLM